MASGEHDLIERLFAPLTRGLPGAFDLTDDAAELAPPPGTAFAVTNDTLIDGVHFLFDGSPEEAAQVAHKALAVNVSDLAAKGAEPHGYLLSIALPEGHEDWLPGFAKGLADAQATFGIVLAGGDTVATPGPFSISITAFGTVPVGGHRGGIIRRSTAKPGDLLFVSGSIGDAWAGLEVQRDEHRAAQWHRCLCTEAMAFLVARSRMPIPRLGLTGPMREFASASLDVSDGLAIDAWRLAKASSVRVEIDTASVPVSPAARSLLERGEIHLHDLITGGDDYEILTTIPADAAEPFKNAAKHANIEVSKIGRVIRGNGLVVLDADGAQMQLKSLGWDHVAGRGN